MTTLGLSKSDLANLLFPHVDPPVWHRLQQVSKRFNQVGKSKLIRKEEIYPDNEKEIWTELPNGNLHGLYKQWYPDGQLHYCWSYVNGVRNGISRVWYINGQLCCEYNCVNGHIQSYSSWLPDGAILCRG